jgi:serine acetyltransferase
VFDSFVMINRGASIGHHVELAPYVSIGPGAVVGGLVRVGRGSVIGAGAVILPELSIGSNSVVGAGSVVIEDVLDNCLVIGNPARILKTGIPGYKGGGVP